VRPSRRLHAQGDGEARAISIVLDRRYLFCFFLVASFGTNCESLPSSLLAHKQFVGLKFQAGLINPDRRCD
jgi:hypothetical protein